MLLRIRSTAVATVLFAAILSVQAHAAEKFWYRWGAGTFEWGDAANWYNADAPGSGDTARFYIENSAHAHVGTGNRTVDRITLDGNYAGATSIPRPAVTVSVGAGRTLTATTSINYGYYTGTGNANGDLTLTGPGSVNTGRIGLGQESTLRLDGGIQATASTIDGTSNNLGTRTWTVTGSSTHLMVGSAALSANGADQFTVSGGATVSTASVEQRDGGGLGQVSGGTLRVTGAGTAWNNSGTFEAGVFAGGSGSTVSVDDGGTLSSNLMTVGSSSAAGTAAAGTATSAPLLHVHDHGIVTTINTLTNYGNATTRIDNGTLSAGNLMVASGGVVDVMNQGLLRVTGTANLADGSHVSLANGAFDAGQINVTGTPSLTGHGVLIGNSSGLTIASPDGAVDYSGDLSIGGRRADIFSNNTAVLRGDVSLANGGRLNSGQTVRLDGNNYLQAGGDVNLTGGLQVSNGAMATVQGGTVDASSHFEIGVAGSSGTLQQSGGTLTTLNQFIVGSAGNGTFNMSGGTVNTASDRILLVGHQDGNGTVNQSGGIINTGEVRLSNANNSVGTYNLSDGTINIADGGVVNVGHFNDAHFHQTGGTINAENGSLIVGNYGDSTFTQTAGTVNASSVVVAQQAGSTSSYSLQGGTLNADSLSYGNGTGTFELAGGTLNITDVTLPTLTMTSGLLDIGTLNGDLNMSGGILAPGDSPGTTTINGDYLLSGGTLEMELAGLTQGTQYDFLDINGDWTISGGSLQLLLLSGFMPVGGNSFDLFDFNSVTGSFDSILLPSLTAGLNWDTSSLYTTGTIAVSGTAAVPEPSTFAITGLGLGFIAWRRRKRNRPGSLSGANGASTSTT